MASKQVIGAIIGIDGATQYIKTLGQISQSTKALQSEMKALTSSFDDNGKTVSQLKAQKETLQKIIDSENDKLYHQQKMLDDVNKAASDVKVTDEKWAKAQQQVATDVNNTTARINELNREMDRLKEQNGLTLFVDAWKEASNKTGEAIKEIGGAMTKYLTVPIVAGMGASVKVATDFESAFTGVKKTVDEIADDNGNIVYSYEQLRKELSKIPLETASTYEDVMAVAEAAGQLGIKADDVSEFTRQIIMLGDSTNISAQDGAVSIAQFLNIVGEAPTTVGQFGSALVELGNNTATDEASILALATRLASAGHLVGLTTPEILGLSAAMSSVGLTAEAGGTAMSTTMKMISKAVAEGSDDLALYGEITGKTAEEFAESWRNNPIEAIQDFLKGMANLDGGSEELILMLDELGFAGIRQSDTLQRLALDYDGVTEAVEMATAAYDENTALSEEAEKRYEDFASQLSQFKESVKQLAASFGEVLLPILKPIVDKLTDWITKFSEMDEGTKEFILTVAGIIAAIGPVLTAFGNILIWTSKVKTAFGVLGGAEGIGKLVSGIGGGASGLIGTLGSLGSKLLTLAAGHPIALGVIAGGAAIYAAYKTNFLGFKDVVDNTVEKVKNKWQEMKDSASNLWNALKEAVTGESKQMSDNATRYAEDTRRYVVQNIDEMKTDSAQKSKEMAESVTKAFNDEKPNVQSASYQMVKTGIDEIKSAKDNAYSYGADLGQQYANGISSKQNTVANAASGLASRIRAFLHFSEPDEGALSDFHTYMPDMMKQMAQGIYDNSYLVEDALSNLTNGMSTQLNGGYTTNYGGVIINLNVPQGTNGQQLVEEIETELANRTMRRKAVFG